MRLVDPGHPFYQPLGTRIAIVASTAIWSAAEIFYAKDGFWGVIAVAVFAYCLWTFIINWKNKDPNSSTDG
jgi:hypothetical protein